MEEIRVGLDKRSDDGRGLEQDGGGGDESIIKNLLTSEEELRSIYKIGVKIGEGSFGQVYR